MPLNWMDYHTHEIMYESEIQISQWKSQTVKASYSMIS